MSVLPAPIRDQPRSRRSERRPGSGCGRSRWSPYPTPIPIRYGSGKGTFLSSVDSAVVMSPRVHPPAAVEGSILRTNSGEIR